MKLLDLYLILWPLPFAFYSFGVSVIGISDSVIMSDWFDCIDGFDIDNQFWDPSDSGALFDWSKEWRQDTVETYLRTLDEYRDLPAGQFLPKKRPFKWFCDDADSFMQMVANKEWHSSGESYRNMTMKSMFKNWTKAVSIYWPQHGGKMSVPGTPKAGSKVNPEKIPRELKKVMFGPALFWSQSDFEEVQRQWELKKRQDLRNSSKRKKQKNVTWDEDDDITNNSNNRSNRNTNSSPPNRSSNLSSRQPTSSNLSSHQHQLASNLPNLNNLNNMGFFSSPTNTLSQSPQKSNQSQSEFKDNEDNQSIHSNDTQVCSCLGLRIA